MNPSKSPQAMVQARMSAKKANLHNNQGMKSSSPAGAQGTKRASKVKATVTHKLGGVSQLKAGVKKGSGVSQQPKVKAKISSLKNLPKPSKMVTAPTSYRS